MSKKLIVLDIDDTQLFDRGTLRTLSADDRGSILALKSKLEETQEQGAIVVHATNAIFSSCMEHKELLADAMHISCMSATELYVRDPATGIYESDDMFIEHLRTLKFSTEMAESVAHDYGDEVIPLLGEHKNEFKISYLFKEGVTEDRARVVLGEIREKAAPFTDMMVNLVVAEKDLYLDVTPIACSKGHVVASLAARYGIADENVIVFGNGGNDISMFQKKFNGVAVGNASADLKAHVQSMQQDGASHIIARGERFHGVVEGLKHFGF
ncbi:MAG: hypothetical protein DI551_03320 [Micavibrio aeruginosavorus]|uniref:Sucrose phosphatase-like domain-containing protein n=1 Tax=Micavibrio aeruginosavorus TaxID=349221 RepID=A0A2W5N1X8_9BACT|nr:MAG: hypothetical protein DI551_03320 [Micavibrio aeruginosavorus]